MALLFLGSQLANRCAWPGQTNKENDKNVTLLTLGRVRRKRSKYLENFNFVVLREREINI